MAQGVLGLGEAYMDGWWDVKQLDQFICKVLLGGLKSKFTDKKTYP
jgi:cyclopropane-fatty-acyl-phospholipid synthase